MVCMLKLNLQGKLISVCGLGGILSWVLVKFKSMKGIRFVEKSQITQPNTLFCVGGLVNI